MPMPPSTLTRLARRMRMGASAVLLAMSMIVGIMLLFAAPSYAEQDASELTPTPTSYPGQPGVFRIAPRVVASGSSGFRLGLNGYDPYTAGAGPVIYWNEMPLSTTRAATGIYEADVPAEFVSITLVAYVSLRNAIGASNFLSIQVSSAPPPLSLPLTIGLTISPGLLSNNNLTNQITVSAADQNGVAVSQTVVAFASSDKLPLQIGALNANGLFPFTHAYSPPPVSIITPTVMMTAFLFSPAAYATGTISVTGVITRELRYFPWVNQAFPAPTPPFPPPPTPTPPSALGGPVIFQGTLMVSNIKAVGDPNLAEADEYVEIRNIGSQPVYVDGWSLKVFVNNQQRDQFIFTAGAVFAAGQLCRIYTNLPSGPDNCGFVSGFANDEPLWPNSGGARASLFNQQNVEVARFSY